MRLEAQGLTLAYRGREVIHDVSLTVESGEFAVIVGPNAGGKSTLLRGLARVMKPSAGHVLLGGDRIDALAPREVARRLAILPQMQAMDLDFVVEELVWRGRTPHHRMLRPATAEDAAAVEAAIVATHLEGLRHRSIRGLSGGERQRAWLALTLAQQPQVLLLDEPTTFLDLRHQVEVMDVLRRLNRDGLTVIAVLHDLSLAARYASRVIGIADGRVAFDGAPEAVLDTATLERVFGIPMLMLRDPQTGQPIPLPAV
ncbi:MAG: ABC transporter ATP-binding protein [Chloroflexi bacterium]|nr:ABC transporter ATP-binding protein [Chloroflexota bacterium]MDA1241136.1 ABC transporter ATP-binding protein [Chloroflexota bacterium]